MLSKTETLQSLWVEARTRFTNILKDISTEDLTKTLEPSQNSIGFLIRHIGDVELLFAKNVFKLTTTKVIAKTVIAKKDTGEWTNYNQLIDYAAHAFKTLNSIITQQTNSDWETIIETKEFGKKTKAEAFGRIISHTTYHAGQIALIKKYGK